ncbi:transcription factor ILI1 [Zea mays]|uniref:BHLH domain-containing protein n=1 Tax=Zea mays TaxID=4577 RepID=A0A804RLL3_MAIZE|nr:transcription factor ILI1-like [Zea mays]|eukprot:XP_008663647.1 transcription factor ILI1-like [Zea mays]
MSSGRRASRARRAAGSALPSSTTSRSISEDQISELLSKIQALLLPNSHTRNGAHRGSASASAARVLQDTCNYIRSLHQEVDNLSELLAELLASADVTSEQAAVIRSLLLM